MLCDLGTRPVMLIKNPSGARPASEGTVTVTVMVIIIESDSESARSHTSLSTVTEK